MYKNFQKICEERGVTPYRVSKDTGVSTSTLSEWKKGKYQPKIDNLQKIAKYFDVPVTYFIQ